MGWDTQEPHSKLVGESGQSLLTSISSSENIAQKERGTPGTGRNRTQSLEFTFSLPSSVPQFLSLEREPLFLDISLAERLCFLKMMHYRAPEISAFPNHTPATLPLLSSSDLPSFWPLQSLCPCCFSCLQHSTWFSQVSLMMSAVERQATDESWAPVLGREKERRARR